MIDIAIGLRELGKSTYANYLASLRKRRVFIDPRMQWPAEDPYLKVDKAEMLQDLDDCRDIVVQPLKLEDTIEELAEVIQAWILERRADPNIDLAIVFDEAGLYKESLTREWGFVFRCSPRKHTSLIVTAHRVMDINTTIRAIADTWHMFRITEEDELDPISKRCGSAVAEALPTLKPYEFVSWYNLPDRKPTVCRDSESWREPRATPVPSEELTVPRKPQGTLW